MKTCILKALRHWWKKLNKTQIHGKNSLCLWIGRINIVKMLILHKAIYIIWCNSYQNFNSIFHKMKHRNKTHNVKMLKFVWNHNRPQIVKQSWERKTKLKASNSLISSNPDNSYTYRRENFINDQIEWKEWLGMMIAKVNGISKRSIYRERGFIFWEDIIKTVQNFLLLKHSQPFNKY